jgi:uncharacterized protein YtpQ (UPF0354 family)
MPRISIVLLSLLASVCASCSDHKPNRNEWQVTLAKPEISQEEFVKAYVDALTEMHPTADIEVIGPLTLSIDIDGYKLRSFLDNAWIDTNEYPEERMERCERHWAGIIKMATADENEQIDQTTVVPIIKDLIYLKEITEMGMEDDPIYHETLVADLIVVYAEDLDHHLSFLTNSEIESLGLPSEGLRSIAIRNLDAKIDKIERYGDGPTYMLSAEGTFEASIILIDAVWDSLAELVEGDFVVAVPSRDMVIFTGTKSVEGIQKLRDLAKSIHENGSYLISKTLIVRRDGIWTRFED